MSTVQDLSKASLREIWRAAKSQAPPAAWAHMTGTAETGSTHRRNLRIFRSLLLKQRVLTGTSDADTSIDLFNQRLRSPILVAPIGSFYMIRPEADREVTEGAAQGGSMLFVSHASKTTVEGYAQEPHPPLVWMGYHMFGHEEVLAIAKQAETLGYAAVGVTIDNTQPTKLGDTVPESSRGGTRRGYTVTPKDIEQLRRETSLPLVVKGIMCQEDARLAVEAGADAVIVSNHGGRIADYSRSALEALPEVVEAVGRKSVVLADSGFRRGTDILKALALGAKAVLVGRPVWCGAAAGGAEGVTRVLEILREELRRSLVLCGVSSVDRVSREILIVDRDSPIQLN